MNCSSRNNVSSSSSRIVNLKNYVELILVTTLRSLVRTTRRTMIVLKRKGSEAKTTVALSKRMPCRPVNDTRFAIYYGLTQHQFVIWATS